MAPSAAPAAGRALALLGLVLIGVLHLAILVAAFKVTPFLTLAFVVVVFLVALVVSRAPEDGAGAVIDQGHGRATPESPAAGRLAATAHDDPRRLASGAVPS